MGCRRISLSYFSSYVRIYNLTEQHKCKSGNSSHQRRNTVGPNQCFSLLNPSSPCYQETGQTCSLLVFLRNDVYWPCCHKILNIRRSWIMLPSTEPRQRKHRINKSLPNRDRNTQALIHPPIHQADPRGTIISRPMNSGTFPFLRYSRK